jgi:hypothetical protein
MALFIGSMGMSECRVEGGDLLPLRRMAARLGVPSKWLREQAECGAVPSLKAGNRFLFVPSAVRAVVATMAEKCCDRQSVSSPEGGAV